jgi:hypothetical protein
MRGSFDAEILIHIVESGLYRNDAGPPRQRSHRAAQSLVRRGTALNQSDPARSPREQDSVLTGLHLRHGIDRLDGDRLDKSTYLFGESRYRYDPERQAAGLLR